MRRRRVSHNRVRRQLRREGHGDVLGSWTCRREMLEYVERMKQQADEARRFDADLAARGLSRADFFVAHVVNDG